MADLPDNPIAHRYDDIVTGLNQIQYAMQQIKLAKQAGLDVAAAEAQANDTYNRLLALKQTYFPGR